MGRWPWLAGAGVAAGLAIWPALAHAGTVGLSYYSATPKGGSAGFSLTFMAAPGEVNDVSIEYSGGAVSIRDAESPLSAAAGCSATDRYGASCPLAPAASVDAIVDLGDGNDVARLANLSLTPVSEIRGGPGNDRLSTAAGAITLDGGDGDDALLGGSGAQRLVGGTGTDAIAGGGGDDYLIGDAVRPSGALVAVAGDMLDGGPGSDTADYAGHGPPITIDLAAGGPQPGADGDRLAGIENVRSGGAGDRLLGDDGPNELTATGARSTAIGRGGDDVLQAERADGGDGDDSFFVFHTAKRFTCGNGEDQIGLTRVRQLIPRDCELVAPTGLLNVRARPRRIGGRWLELRLAVSGSPRLEIRVLDGARGTLLATGPVRMRGDGQLRGRPARVARLRLTRAGRRALAAGRHPLIRIVFRLDGETDAAGSDGYSVMA